jgi:hypothetical protein
LIWEDARDHSRDAPTTFIVEHQMSQQWFLFRAAMAISAAWLIAACVCSAPAPEDEKTPDELAVEPAKGTEEQAERNRT